LKRVEPTELKNDTNCYSTCPGNSLLYCGNTPKIRFNHLYCRIKNFNV